MKEPARALEEMVLLLEKAQEVAHIGSWVWTPDGSARWSAETFRILGLDPAVVQPSIAVFLERVHPDDADGVRKAGQAVLGSGTSNDIDYRIVRPDGEVRWMHGRADVIRDEAGQPLRMIGTIQDVTDQRRLEEELRSAQRLEALGRLAGGVAHDLNNALTAIAGYTELALGVLDESHPARPDVQEIRRAAERAESVTRQLLAFSRRQPLTPRVFSLEDSIATLARLLQRLIGEDVALVIDVARALPPIHGDPGQIEQAILNLVVNARDAMPEGGRLTIRAAAIEATEEFARTHQPLTPGPYVELRVSDTGHGMTPEVRAHIFEPFFTTKELGKGTGLGLAMVYGTIQQSGGFIFVDSEAGRGTTFRLYFRPSPRTEPGSPAADPVLGATILVVEDEAAVRNLVLAALASEGYRLLPAASAEEALEVAARDGRTIDLLLTDANMPGIGGVELAARLTAIHPALRVVVMSGYTDGEVSVPGSKSPVSFMPKPFTPKELRLRIRDVLAKSA